MQALYTGMTAKDKWVGLIMSSLLLNIFGLVFPLTVIQVYDRVLTNNSIETLNVFILIVVTVMCFELLFKILRAYISIWIDSRFGYKNYITAFNRLLHSDYVSFHLLSSNKYIDKINSLETIREMTSGKKIVVYSDVCFVFLYVGLLFMISYKLAVLASIIGLLSVITLIKFKYNFKEIYFNKKNNYSEKYRMIIEMLSGIHAVKANGIEEKMLRKYEWLQRGHVIDEINYVKKQLDITKISNIFGQIMTVSIVFWGCKLIFVNELTIGGMAASIMIAGKIMQPLSKFLTVLSKQNNLELSESEFKEIMSITQEVNKNNEFDLKSGKIEFKNVSYKRNNSNEDELSNINLIIESNTSLIIHGESVSLETTLIYLLLGILSPSKGKILVDGKDVLEINKSYYRKQVSYISGYGSLFRGTVMENITMFDSSESTSMKAKKIAEEIGLAKTIEHMPKGYFTEISNLDSGITPGTKQKILIVRALVHDSKIIICNEAHIGLDKISQRRFKDYLSRLKKNHTIIFLDKNNRLSDSVDKEYELVNKNIKEIYKDE